MPSDDLSSPSKSADGQFVFWWNSLERAESSRLDGEQQAARASFREGESEDDGSWAQDTKKNVGASSSSSLAAAAVGGGGTPTVANGSCSKVGFLSSLLCVPVSPCLTSAAPAGRSQQLLSAEDGDENSAEDEDGMDASIDDLEEGSDPAGSTRSTGMEYGEVEEPDNDDGRTGDLARDLLGSFDESSLVGISCNLEDEQEVRCAPEENCNDAQAQDNANNAHDGSTSSRRSEQVSPIELRGSSLADSPNTAMHGPPVSRCGFANDASVHSPSRQPRGEHDLGVEGNETVPHIVPEHDSIDAGEEIDGDGTCIDHASFLDAKYTASLQAPKSPFAIGVGAHDNSSHVKGAPVRTEREECALEQLLQAVPKSVVVSKDHEGNVAMEVPGFVRESTDLSFKWTPSDLSPIAGRASPETGASNAAANSAESSGQSPSILRQQQFWRHVGEAKSAQQKLVKVVLNARATVGRLYGRGCVPGEPAPSLAELENIRNDLSDAVDECPEGVEELDDTAVAMEEELDKIIVTLRTSAPASTSSRSKSSTERDPIAMRIQRDEFVDQDAVARQHLSNLVLRVRAVLLELKGPSLPAQSRTELWSELPALQQALALAIDACPDGDEDLDDAAIGAEVDLERVVQCGIDSHGGAAGIGSGPVANSMPHRPNTSAEIGAVVESGRVKTAVSELFAKPHASGAGAQRSSKANSWSSDRQQSVPTSSQDDSRESSEASSRSTVSPNLLVGTAIGHSSHLRSNAVNSAATTPPVSSASSSAARFGSSSSLRTPSPDVSKLEQTARPCPALLGSGAEKDAATRNGNASRRQRDTLRRSCRKHCDRLRSSVMRVPHTPNTSSWKFEHSVDLPAFPHKPRPRHGPEADEAAAAAEVALHMASVIIAESSPPAMHLDRMGDSIDQTGGIQRQSAQSESFQTGNVPSFSRSSGSSNGALHQRSFTTRRRSRMEEASQRRREAALRRLAAEKAKEEKVRMMQLAARLNGPRRRRQLLSAANSLARKQKSKSGLRQLKRSEAKGVQHRGRAHVQTLGGSRARAGASRPKPSVATRTWR